MKNLYLLAIILLSSIFSGSNATAQLTTIIDGSNESITAGPLTTFYNYGLYQTIYLQSEVGSGAVVNGCQWEWDGSHSTTRTIKIWLGHTSQADFANNSQYVPTTSMSLVYSGTLSLSGGVGWTAVTFDDAFIYNGTDNLVIAVEDNTGSYTGSSNNRFKCFTLSSNADDRTLYQYSDNNNYTMESPTFSGRVHRQPSLKLDFATCSSPTSPTASLIESTTATISWTAASTPPGIAYDYYYSEINTAPTTTGTGSTPTNTTLTQALTGLIPATTYYYWVRSDCDGTDKSSWVSGGSFTTLCDPVPAPFSETFDGSSTPNCWSQSATSGGPWVFGTGTFTWQIAACGEVPIDFTGNGGNFAALDLSNGVSGGGSSADDDVDVVLEMVTVDVSALTSPVLQFKHFMCGVGYTPLNSTYVEAYNGSTWLEIAQIQSGEAAWIPYEYDLTTFVYNTNFVRIRFRAERGACCGEMYMGDIAIDDVAIDEKSCTAPISLTSSLVTSTTATISWSQASLLPSDGYQYYLSTSATAPTSGTAATDLVGAGIYTKDLTSLTGGIPYYYWVRSDCGLGGLSDWSSGGTFTTLSCEGPTVSASSFQKSSIGNTTASFSWTDGNGAGVLVVASESPLSGNPVEATTYAGNPAYGAGDALLGGFVVYSGTVNSLDLTGLTAGTTYYLGFYEYTASPGCYNSTATALLTAIQTSPVDLVLLGTGTTSSDGTYGGPFYNYYENAKTQMLYKASELGGVGDITDISFDINQIASSSYRAFTNFSIKLMHTSTTSFGTAYESTASATEVYAGASTYTMPASTGWLTFDITDFTYNGTDNLLVEIVWGDNGTWTYTPYYINHTDYSSGAEYLLTYGRHDSETPPNYDGRSYIRPNVQFTKACNVGAGVANSSESSFPTCETTTTLSLSGQDGGTTLQWQWSPDDVTYYDIDGATTASEIAPYLTQASTWFRCAVTNGCISYAGTPLVSTSAPNCNFWEGTTSTDADVASNWSLGVVPSTASADVLIPRKVENSCTYSTEINNGVSMKDLWIQDGATYNAGTKNQIISGDFINNGTFNSSIGLVTMSGTGAQAINGSAATSFYNYTNKNVGAGVTLGVATTIQNTFTLSSGILDASSFNLTLPAAGTVIGGEDESHVKGTMVKTTASTSEFTFPLGDGTQYKAITITPSSGSSTVWTAEYILQANASTLLDLDGSLAGDLDHVSTYEYWDLDRSGSANAIIAIPWVANNAVLAYADLRLAHYDGSDWDMITATPVGDNTSGVITSGGYVSNYSPFTLGSSSSTNALPVELVSFSGIKKDNNNILNWTTASEINNAYFTVEKSYNGFDFEWVGTQEGTSPSTQIVNYSLTDYNIIETLNYYRLKQTDFDGKFEYSNIISIDNRVDDSFKEIIGRTNLLGQEVDEFYNGIVIVRYKDGTSQKFYQFK